MYLKYEHTGIYITHDKKAVLFKEEINRQYTLKCIKYQILNILYPRLGTASICAK